MKRVCTTPVTRPTKRVLNSECLIDTLPVDSWLHISALNRYPEEMVFSCKYFLRMFLDQYCLEQVVDFYLKEQKVDREAYLKFDLIRANLPAWLCRAIPMPILGAAFNHLHIHFDLTNECDNNAYFKNRLVTELAGKEKIDFFLTGGAITRAAFADHWSLDSDVWLKREKTSHVCLQAGEKLEAFEAEMYQLHLHPIQHDYQQALEEAVAQTLSVFLGRGCATKQFEIPRHVKTREHTKQLSKDIIECLKQQTYHNLHRVIQEASLSVSQAGILYTRGEHLGVSYPKEVQFVTPLWMYTKYTNRVIHRGLTCKEKHAFPNLGDLATSFHPQREDIKLALERVLNHYLHDALQAETETMLTQNSHFTSSPHDVCPTCIDTDHLVEPELPVPDIVTVNKKTKKYSIKEWRLAEPQPPQLHPADKKRVMKASIQTAYKAILDFLIVSSKYSHRLPAFNFIYVGSDTDVIEQEDSIHSLSLLVYLAFHGTRDILSHLCANRIRDFLKQNNKESI